MQFVKFHYSFVGYITETGQTQYFINLQQNYPNKLVVALLTLLFVILKTSTRHTNSSCCYEEYATAVYSST